MLRHARLPAVLVLLAFIAGAAATELTRKQQAEHRFRIDTHMKVFHDHKEVRQAEMSRGGRNLLQSATIRITPEYQLTSATSNADQQRIAMAVQAAIATFETFVKVKVPTDSNGLLAYAPSYSGIDTKCDAAVVNQTHKAAASCVSNGILNPACATTASGSPAEQTDFVIYVLSDSGECGDSTAAYALPCFYSTATNRPLIGMLNLCPISLSGYTNEQLIATTTHEIMHALAMNNDLFDMFIDSSGSSLLGRANVVETVTNNGAGMRTNFNQIITPRVVAEAREQFGCPTLTGAALEENGGAGSANSHWEFELFQGDFMVSTDATDNAINRFSRVTLALMEDSGWYEGIWSGQAAHLDWGRYAGCGFTEQTCDSYATNNASQPWFCLTAGTTLMCNHDHRSRGSCAVSTYNPACNLVTTGLGDLEPLATQSCTSTAFSQAGESMQTAGTTAFGWSQGADSRCLQTSLPLQTSVYGISSSGSSMALCWSAACSNNNLVFTINGQSVTCTSGTSIALNTVAGAGFTTGTITCPDDVMAVCRTLGCGACDATGGECFEGTCICRFGKTGSSCSETATPASLTALTLPNSLQNSSPTPPGDGSDGSGLSTGAIVGIAVGAAVGAIAVGVAVWFAVWFFVFKSGAGKSSSSSTVVYPDNY